MKRTLFTSIIMLAITAIMLQSCTNHAPQIANPRCEYSVNPIGIDNPQPRFTWHIASDSAVTQKSCQLQIATTPELLDHAPDVWQSDILDTQAMQLVYDGKTALKAHQSYYWKVTVWDTDGHRYDMPKAALFKMAKLNEKDWQAQWISDGKDKAEKQAPLFRKRFDVSKKIGKAYVYVSGLGYYELYINGKRIGKNYLDPGYTQFDKRVLYVTHEVTENVRKGENILAAVLGNGWYNVQSRGVWDFEKAAWRKRPQLLCELRIEYADGTTATIASDTSWKCSTGAYTFNNIYSGDRYDARLEQEGWNQTKFDDSKWQKAQIVSRPAPVLQAQIMPGIHITKEIEPVSCQAFGDTLYVFDLGENIAGLSRLRVKGTAGTELRIRHGELLKENGRLEQGNINIYFRPEDPDECFQEDRYILKGEGEETFMPSFCYHGFQYVEVQSSQPIALTKESLTGLFMHTDVEAIGQFECSNETLNKIWQATRRSYLSNMHSIPTDCPQREKNGWTGDAQLSVDLGLLHYDGILFYEKWLRDIIDNQRAEGDISGIVPSCGWGYGIGPVWDGAMFIIPHALYMYYGDPYAIKEIYDTCERYLTYLNGKEEDGCIRYGLGDWLSWKDQTPTDYSSTCFYYLCNKHMAQFARIAGKPATPYEEKAETIKQVINTRFFDAENATYANGTQTAQALAIYLNIVPAEKRDAVARKLAEKVKADNVHLNFGSLGSKVVLRALTQTGYVDLAYRMATQTDAPSWGYWVDSQKQTTLGETWTMSPRFNDASLNHVFMGDIIAWMQNALAGINYDESQPGFTHFFIAPHFIADLNHVKGSYRSVKGLITSEWRRNGDKVELTVTVPANTSATVILPEKQIEVGSGTHRFVF